jgi:hypothetical protein
MESMVPSLSCEAVRSIEHTLTNIFCAHACMCVCVCVCAVCVCVYIYIYIYIFTYMSQLTLPGGGNTTQAFTPNSTLSMVLQSVCEKRKLDRLRIALKDIKTNKLYESHELELTTVSSLATNELEFVDLAQLIGYVCLHSTLLCIIFLLLQLK